MSRIQSKIDALPSLVFPEILPVSAKRQEIAAAIQNNQVIIVCGDTGSGKTTQIPKICLSLGRGIDGLIGHTQPRRIAARTIASRIAGDNEADEETAREDAILSAINELSTAERGDVLIFLEGEREIHETSKFLEKQNLANTDILPLYARLNSSRQSKIFRSHKRRHIVLATNVAETSLTIPGIRFVIDAGYARISRYSHGSKVQRLPVEKISRASADQRKGRCGRVADGICVRLYSETAEYQNIHCALLSGLLSHVAVKTDTNEYLGARNIKLHVFPGSGQFSKTPKWIVAAEVAETTRLYARVVAKIDSQWLLNVGKHLLKRNYSQPYWDAKSQQVSGYEKVMLFGMTVVPGNRINFGPVDPEEARHIFIRHALVYEELNSKAEFYQHNLRNDGKKRNNQIGNIFTWIRQKSCCMRQMLLQSSAIRIIC